VIVVLPLFRTTYVKGMATPGALYVVTAAVFAIVSAGAREDGNVWLTVGDVVVPDVADATFVTPPASISACVVVYDAVQVRLAPGANPPAGSAGHVTDAILLSVTVTGCVIVVLPVFVTTNVYGTTVPTALNEIEVVLLTIVRADARVDGTVTLTVGDVVVPDVADAVFVTPPASTSACVVV
jgi:hypothetical protein